MSSISKIAVPLMGFGGVIAAASMLLAAPTHADSTEDAYLNGLRANGIVITPSNAAFGVGHLVCALLYAGETSKEVSAVIADKAEMPSKTADVVVRESVTAFCPSQKATWL